jgi:hypothetical protein
LTLSKLLRVSEPRNILHEIRKRKANWIGHILRRNCLIKQVIEGKIKSVRRAAAWCYVLGVKEDAYSRMPINA